jgi:hypothetical protein
MMGFIGREKSDVNRRGDRALDPIHFIAKKDVFLLLAVEWRTSAQAKPMIHDGLEGLKLRGYATR